MLWLDMNEKPYQLLINQISISAVTMTPFISLMEDVRVTGGTVAVIVTADMLQTSSIKNATYGIRTITS